MSDAYYGIARDRMHGNRDKIFFIHMWGLEDTESFVDKIPTYTVSELLYKLHEYIYPTINKKKYSGGLRFLKDAPFYIWYYKLTSEHNRVITLKEDYIYARAEYPIESLAMLLIQCHKKDIGMKTKDTGDISNKGIEKELKSIPFKLEKGKWYLCIKNYTSPSIGIIYQEGNKYFCDAKGHLVDDLGRSFKWNHYGIGDQHLEYFKPIKEL